MRYRNQRIAWSVGCAIACVLLIALWVRSYRWHMHFYPNMRLGIDFYYGWISIYTTPLPAKYYGNIPRWLSVVATMAIAPTAWIRRFSLRALLITTTLLAVTLGLIVRLR